MSFKEDLGKARNWLRKNVIGRPCYYCKKLTTGRRSTYYLSTKHNEDEIALCNSSECRIAFSESWKLEEERINAETAAFEKAAAEEKAAKEKAAAEEKAAREKYAAEKKAQQEAMEKRESEAVGMVNAGIPEEIVELWVSGELEKGDMFAMLKTFNKDLPKWSTELINIAQKTDIPRFFTDDIKQNITILKSLISDHKSEMVKFTFQKHSQFDEQALEFLQKCQTEDHLYPLYLEILERDFDLEFAYKLVNDFGFNEHPEALKEVIAGSNWEAVAVKYGFLQFD